MKKRQAAIEEAYAAQVRLRPHAIRSPRSSPKKRSNRCLGKNDVLNAPIQVARF
jgi:hypothetical protein